MNSLRGDDMRNLVFAACLTTGLLLSAQNNSHVVRGSVPVQTIITLEARHDHEKDVPPIRREDVMALERHERLQVTDLVPLQGENAGLELFFLLDDGSSASLGSQLSDLRHFIEAQPATTSIGIAYMRNGTAMVAQDLTAHHGDAAKALWLPLSFPEAMASPYLSLSDLIKRWPATSKRREVVLITSGIDPLGGMGAINPYMDSAIEDAQRHGIVVYAIYTTAAGHGGHSFFRMNWAQSHLAQIAEETGGEAYMLGFGHPVSFALYLDEIAVRLAHQWPVTLLLRPENKGAFRDVRFSTELADGELISASKVYVPAHGGQPNK